VARIRRDRAIERDAVRSGAKREQVLMDLRSDERDGQAHQRKSPAGFPAGLFLNCVGGVRPDQQKVRWTFCPAERRSIARSSAMRGRDEALRKTKAPPDFSGGAFLNCVGGF